MASRSFVGFIVLVTFSLAGCSSSYKKRQQEREKLSASSGLLCDFVNGDDFQDVEVELNLQMARRCDSGKDFSISGYKNSSDVHGMVFCCAIPKKEDKRAEAKSARLSKRAGKVAQGDKDDKDDLDEADADDDKASAPAAASSPSLLSSSAPAPSSAPAAASSTSSTSASSPASATKPAAPAKPAAPTQPPADRAPRDPDSLLD